jgi:5-methylthioribose kinase
LKLAPNVALFFEAEEMKTGDLSQVIGERIDFAGVEILPRV